MKLNRQQEAHSIAIVQKKMIEGGIAIEEEVHPTRRDNQDMEEVDIRKKKVYLRNKITTTQAMEQVVRDLILNQIYLHKRNNLKVQ